MNFLYDGTDNVDFECINRTILDGNFIKMSLIVTEINHGAIDADDSEFTVTILSYFLHLRIPFKKILIYMVKSFLLVKWYVKEIIIFQ